MFAEGWIVAGGQSLRMGRDKALVEIGGERLLNRMLGKLRSLGLGIRIAGLRTPALAGSVEVFPDEWPRLGPLSGIATALRHSRAEYALILGVDLPLLSVAFLSCMLRRAEVTGALATVPRLLGTPQPMCAVYSRELLESVEAALHEGERKVMAAVERGGSGRRGVIDLFSVESLAAVHAWDTVLPASLEFMNCNTQAEAAIAEQLDARCLK